MIRNFLVFAVCILVLAASFLLVVILLPRMETINQEREAINQERAEWLRERNLCLEETRRLEAGLQFFMVMAQHRGTMEKPYRLKKGEVIFLPSISYTDNMEWSPGSGRIVSGNVIVYWSPVDGVIVESHDDSAPEIDYEIVTNDERTAK